MPGILGPGLTESVLVVDCAVSLEICRKLVPKRLFRGIGHFSLALPLPFYSRLFNQNSTFQPKLNFSRSLAARGEKSLIESLLRFRKFFGEYPGLSFKIDLLLN
jgi:hypothetical protein